MLLIPSILDDSLDADYIINKFAPPNKYSFGIVAFVPSKKKSNLYKTLGATIAEKDTIFDEINRLKNNTFGTVLVIKNRYDGIDLPDNACRILLMDSLPMNRHHSTIARELSRNNNINYFCIPKRLKLC